MAIKIFHWESNDIINQPSTKKKSFGSDSELQKIVSDISDNLPDILSSDKKGVLKDKLKKYKSVWKDFETLKSELNQANLKLGALEIWEDNKELIQQVVGDVLGTTKKRLESEIEEEEKAELEEKIAKLEQLSTDVSGTTFLKNQLEKLIQERINVYGYDDLENKFPTDEKDWKDEIEKVTGEEFEKTRSNLLERLAELISDFWLTTTSESKSARVEIIEKYLAEATDLEKAVINSNERKEVLIKLKNSLKSQKEKFSLTVEGEITIIDENNEDDNRSIVIPFQKDTFRTTFEDSSAFSKLTGINKTNQITVFFNFEEDEKQTRRFKELKEQLRGYAGREIVFHFDKLEAENGDKLVRIEDKEIHLDYGSYTLVEVSGGTELPKDWGNITSDKAFSDFNLVKNWTDLSFTYEQTKDWIDIGINPDEQKLVSWLIGVKGGNYKNPGWVLSNADVLTLRKEWLEYEIKKRFEKYKTGGFDVEVRFEKKGGKDGDGHWGSEGRGKTWKEYLDKINNLKSSGDDKFSYYAVRGGLLKCLAETLFPEFVLRNFANNMPKKDLLKYMNQNCTVDEKVYYNNVDGTIVKMKEEEWKEKSVRAIVNVLSYNK